jgi:hypothetical protein
MTTGPQFKSKQYLPYLLSCLTGLAMLLALYSMGRLWWCKLGDWAIYINFAWNSSHTSQHLFDPYSFTHLLHGVAFFLLTYLLSARVDLGWRFLISVSAEAAWEVFENTRFIIEKYRANTASLDYFGDSIANSAGDLIACALGFLIAAKLGWIRAVIFFVAVETALLLWIRDGLLLNILMLIYPLEAIKTWQMQ